jgi:hypothetical protein
MSAIDVSYHAKIFASPAGFPKAAPPSENSPEVIEF